MTVFDKRTLTTIAALATLVGVVLALGDRVGAPLRDVSPSDGSAPPVTTTLSITFGSPMDRPAVESRLRINPPLDFDITWEGSTMIAHFDRALEPGVTYTAALEGGAHTARGREVHPYSWSFVPREPRVLYLAPASGEVRSLWLASMDGSVPPSQLFAPDGGILDFSPSADGAQVAVTVPRGDGAYDIWLVDVDGGQAAPLLACAPASCSSPAFSPDGMRLAYERREPMQDGDYGPARIWLLDLRQGGSAPVYADEDLTGFGSSWSPDGGRLAFIDVTLGAIRVVDLQTEAAALLPSQMGQVGVFAPDGSQMIYVEIQLVGGQFFSQLQYVDLNGDQGVRPLLDDAEEDQWPAWSPDGRWLAFGRRLIDRSTGFGSQLMLLDLETGNIEAATADPQFNNLEFVWDPTGRYLVFSRFRLGAEGATPGVWLFDTRDQALMPLAEDALDANWLP